MDNNDNTDETKLFDYGEIKQVIESTIEPILGNVIYASDKVQAQSNLLIEEILKKLAALDKPFKYVVTCILLQNNGAGIHSASTCWWDSKTDGQCSLRWNNTSIHAIITVYALHI